MELKLYQHFPWFVETPPFEPQAKTVKNIDTRLTVRAMSNHDFTEIHTPKIIACNQSHI